MPNQAWEQAVVTQRAAGTLFTTYTTAKTIINQQDLYSFYPNFFQLGTKLRITAHMAVSNIATTPGTMTFQVMLGSVVAFTTGALQLSTTAHTLLSTRLVIDLTCQLANTGVGGAVAKLMGQGVLTSPCFVKTSGADSVVTECVINVPQTSPVLGTAFDGTISQILDFWAGFSISNSGNGVQMMQYDVEILN